MSNAIDLAEVRKHPAGFDVLDRRVLFALVDAVEAAHKVTLVEDLYRGIPSELRKGTLEVVEPHHRKAMDDLRKSLEQFAWTT